MSKKLFGKTKDGKEVYIYELTNKNNMKACILDYGANLQALYVPDENGKVEDIVLGYDDVASYEENGSFFGAVIAPSANRIGDASFSIDGVEYKIDVNDGKNNLHSHYELGAHKRIWQAKEGENSVELSLAIEDMDMGFPGNKDFTLTYTLTDENELILHYYCKSDKNTIVNPTNHSYFNLYGAASGKDILDCVLTLNCSSYTPVVPGAIPTGEIKEVKGSVMDFTGGRRIGDDINASFDQLVMTQGYDHNFVVDGWDGKIKEIATVEAPGSLRKMTVLSDLPGVQFYAGNCIGKGPGKEGIVYDKRSALCLETQFYPDTIHHDNFPGCVFGPGKDYESTTIYKF